MILDEIAKYTKTRVENLKEVVPFEEVRACAEKMNKCTGFQFEKALSGNDISFICEVKKASPSLGVIAHDFPYVEIAKEYEKAGAAAISVLTEPKYFMGDDKYLTEISKNVSIPILRKDFTVDSYQIYEAKTLGAHAVLLICELTEETVLKEYIEIAHSLGLSALVEAHSEKAVLKAIKSGARIIGVNNRNLQTFDVDINNSIKLREIIPKNILFISESGIKTAFDIDKLRKINANAVLIGETLMRKEDKKREICILRGEI